MPTLYLGNTAPVEVVKTESGKKVSTKRHTLNVGNTVTEVQFPDGWDLGDQLAALGDLWNYHSDDPPEWVESEDGLLAEVAARRFTNDDHTCEVGRPKGWKEG
jgi:hypothetical protein